MNKQQKILIFGATGVLACLIALIIVLIVRNSRASSISDEALQLQMQNDSLRHANDQLELASLTNEFDRLNAEFDRYENQELTLTNDSLVKQYTEAREKINSLMAELAKEKKSNNANKAKIKQLEAEIGTLKDIAKHYLAEIKRLNDENQGLREELTSTKEKNETLARQNSDYTRQNSQLSETVKLAKKLNITNLSFQALNKKDKNEKKISKATKLGVSFVVSPNNTAAPGMKDFFIRIISPDGDLLGNGKSFSYDGATLSSTASRTMEYNNTEQLPVSIYWDVTKTLQTGDYTVEVFCDGYRIGSHRFNMAK